jgi:hypothetical protein
MMDGDGWIGCDVLNPALSDVPRRTRRIRFKPQGNRVVRRKRALVILSGAPRRMASTLQGQMLRGVPLSMTEEPHAIALL